MTTPDGAYVARIWSQGDMLAINRDHEHHNSVAAAQAGVGAPVVAYRPEDSLLVLGYIDGRTFGNADVAEPANIGRIARACRLLHAGPRFLGDFDMFAIQQRYRAVAREHGFAIPAGYDDLMGHVEDARAALAVRAGPHRAVQQRSARRQLHRRRGADLADRLRVLGQQRRLFRAGQHLGRVQAVPGRAGRR